MVGRLVVIAGPDKGRVFPLAEGQTLLIGRARDIEGRLRDPHVSRKHCNMQVAAGKVMLADADSATGTLVTGKPITGDQEIHPGDVIQVGHTQLRFEVDPAGENTADGPVGVLAQAPVIAGDVLSDLVGKTLSRFVVGAEIARGATGIVFQARDPEKDRLLALKVLYPQISGEEEEIRRFVRAMKTILPLRHPNLVTVYNAGKTGPFAWIAMELVEGESLTQVIERIGIAGMLDWRYSLRVGMQIGRALEFASEKQIIHRNITPANILMRTSDKVAKLGDLMLAKALEGTLAEKITGPGQLVGAIAYMSPERTRSAGDVDGRADLYSLGAAMYALLTGRPLFSGAALRETLTKIRHDEPAKPTQFQLSIPGMFEDIVLRLVAKRPEDRFQTPAALLSALERVAKFEGEQV